MRTPVRLLLVEDSTTDAKLIEYAFRSAGWPVTIVRVETAHEMRAALQRDSIDAVLSDWSLPRFSGLAALALLRELERDLPFIIVSGTVGEEAAADAMREGASDYVLKDHLARLMPALERELEAAARSREKKKTEGELRRAEAELRQAQRLEAIGSLAAGIAHDFNNLLSVILGMCELLLDDVPKESSVAEGIDEIRTAGQRGAQLTQQLLAFARRQVLQPQHADLDTIVSGVHKMLRRIVGEHIEIVVVPSPGLARAFVDPAQVEQIILNLAVNARDAMPDGGTLILETGNVSLDAAATTHTELAPGAYVMLAVSDTGTGMDEATRARIFEPFFTTKPPGKGTGLGMSTVLGIVQQSGGGVFVYTELGKGTTVKLYFPQSQGVALSASAPPPSRVADLRGVETILVAEDDESVRRMTRAILQRYGYTVLEGRHGADALDVAARYSERIDLLLTDVIMPGMNGRQLEQALRQARPDVRVLYMSGYTDTAAIQHGVLEPGITLIQKPLTPVALMRKVREVLAG